MLTAANNEMLTRVGPGTPMGNLMREYWIPACLSSELKADGEPMRLLLLGEQLIAFRDTDGRVGIMEHRCPHRCASLFFGRNEEGGLRCVYHGWKFDVEGNCVDMPNVPPAQDFKDRIKAKAYKVVERAGFVWTYMGARQQAPPLPNVEVLMLPEEERFTRVHQRECNWFQSLEGDIDTSHFGFLHIGGLKIDDVDPNTIHKWGVGDRAPDYKSTETEWGTMYAAYRPAEPGTYYYRFAHFMFPFITLTPNGSFEDQVACTLNVPMDDTHTMTYNLDLEEEDAAARDAEERRLDPRPEARRRVPAQHQRLVRPSSPRGAARERLLHRSRHAEERQLHRHPGHRPAGPGDDRMHGRDRRSLARASGALRPHDRHHAQAPARGGAGADEREEGAGDGRQSRHLSRRARRSFVASAKLDWLDAYAEKLQTATSPLGLLNRLPLAAE